jgi:hypothetical protein
MKKQIFLLLGLFLAVVANVQSGNVYVYAPNGSRQLLANVESIEFSPEAMVVNLYFGEPVFVGYSDMVFFSLKDYGQVTEPTAIPEMKVTNAVNVFPNPVVNEVTITNTEGITAVTLVNVQGRQLLQLTPGATEITVPLTAFPAGVYFLQIIGENGTTVKKIIKK